VTPFEAVQSLSLINPRDAPDILSDLRELGFVVVPAEPSAEMVDAASAKYFGRLWDEHSEIHRAKIRNRMKGALIAAITEPKP
jgi:hypothetical protein